MKRTIRSVAFAVLAAVLYNFLEGKKQEKAEQPAEKE